MTVYYCPEDAKTVRLLEHFGGIAVPQVRWDWRPLERTRLLRRAIGRNLAAKASTANWIWFTDCDVWWHTGCLDALARQLDGCRERLVFQGRSIAPGCSARTTRCCWRPPTGPVWCKSIRGICPGLS